ncbi:hypothetical protein STIUS_v1c00770 [Spiroplasma sp. TIUS-1]|uniref:ABC transporter permease n=1 Tax=Spiroplasma sp. TIUS-1 TaxID=216963 RepID=UPI001397CFC6|nr:ABC transporter permease [Spiroplasma sp. TIUS-1]QHX35632.1 hypothetical protein STIUS_v1c00770 [Spiroplasma sp. TIUS-1]
MKQLWLLFKQGTKALFRQKIQFFILIILSFLAVFYLATSTSVTQRMNKMYNDVVKNYEKFDYTYTRKADESNLVSKNETFLPILDFMPEQLNYVKSNNKYENDSFNLQFNTFDESNKKSFISDAMFDENGKVKSKFKSIWEILAEENFQSLLGSFLGQSLYFEIDLNKGQIKYSYQDIELNFMNGVEGILESISGDQKNGLINFVNDITSLLADSLYSRFKEVESGLYSTENLSLFEMYFIENKKLELDFRKPEFDENIKKYKNIWEIPDMTETETYIYNALESVAFDIVNQWQIYVQRSISRVNEMVSELKPWESEIPFENEEKLIEAYTNYFNNFNKIAFNSGEVGLLAINIKGLKSSGSEIILNNPSTTKPSNSDSSMRKDILNSFFSYMYGTYLFDDYVMENNFYKSLDNKYIYDANGEGNKKLKFAHQVEDISILETNSDEYIKITQKNILGKRGYANPLYLNYDNELSIMSMETYESLSVWEKVNPGIKIASQLSAKKSDITDRDYSNKSIYSMNVMHQEMAANISNLNLLIREEAYYYDREQGVNFRFVIFDDVEKFNLKIIAGLEAVTSNEVVVSQQFAIANNINVGDSIMIGSTSFIVSGLGVDVLTYYPLGDPDIPVSDAKSNAIVYLPKSVIRSMMSTGMDKDTVFSTIYFLDDNKTRSSDKEITKKVNMFDSLLMSNKTKFQMSYDKFIDNNFEDTSFINSYIKDFAKTNFALNWDLQPMILKIINTFSLIASLIIVAIVVYTLLFTIKKLIDRNAQQIGFLKAMGTKPTSIAVSYLGYSLIIGIIVVPVAWISAGLFQEVISSIFSKYMSTTMYEFIFDWKILIIAICLFQLFAMTASYLMTLYLIRKPALEIINHESNVKIKDRKYKSKFFEGLSFKYRFPIKISARGWKQITITVVSVFVATIIITFSAAVPSVLNLYVKNSTQNITYENKYIQNNPVSNIPTARQGITATEGLPNLNKQFTEPKEIEDIVNIYFDRSQLYNDSVWDSTITPKMIYSASNDEVRWFEEHALAAKNGSVGTNFLPIFINQAIGKVTNLNGYSFSPGLFESIIAYIWNTDINLENGNIHNESMSQIANIKLKQIKAASNQLNSLVPQLFELFSEKLEELVGEIPKVDDWKQALLLLALAFVPGVGMKYLSESPNRMSQFVLGLNSENYTPDIETLSTTLNIKLNNSDATLLGLKEGQKAFDLNGENSNAFIKSQKDINDLNELFKNPEKFDKDININGINVYSHVSKTLTIPVITNSIADKQFNTSGIVNSFKITEAKLNSKEGVTIPKGAWVYDNRIVSESTEIINFLMKENNITDKNSEEFKKIAEPFINPDTIPASKMTLSNIYNTSNPEKVTLNKNGASMFIDSWISTDAEDINSDTAVKYAIRPEYQMSNIKLFIPVEATEEKNTISFLQNSRYANLEGLKNYNLTNNDKEWLDIFTQSKWAGEISSSAATQMIPVDVLNSWGDKYKNSNWIWIAPYHPKNNIKSGASGAYVDDVNSIKFAMPWLTEVIGTDSSAITITDDYQYNMGIKNIKLEKVGTLNTKSGNEIIADQDIVNLLAGLSTIKYIPVDYNYYGEVKGTYKIDEGNQTFKMYDTRTPKEQLEFIKNNNSYYMKNELSKLHEQPLMFAMQNKDFNTKYSSFKEPYGVTSGVRVAAPKSPGFLDPENFDDLQSQYMGIEVLGSKMGVIINVAETIMLVSLFLIIGILIIVGLIISILSDIFVSKYSKFIVTMRSMGYDKKTIVANTMFISGICNLIFVILGIVIGLLLVNKTLTLMGSMNLIIPFQVHWWVIFIVAISIIIIIVLSATNALHKTFKRRLITLT